MIGGGFMLYIMGALIIIVTIIMAANEKAASKPIPPNAVFDWDAYYADIASGMDKMEQIKKRKRGEYYITKKLTEAFKC